MLSNNHHTSYGDAAKHRATGQLIFSPGVLFALAAVQALFPYALWLTGIRTENTPTHLTFTPVLIWAIAVASFWAGCRIRTKSRRPTPMFTLAQRQHGLHVISVAILISIFVQLYGIVRVYGTVPLLSYLRNDGAISVATVNTLEESSGFGQVGTLGLFGMVLNGVLLMVMIVRANRGLSLGVMGWTMGACSLLISTYAGKRQGLLVTLVYLSCGLSLHFPNPLKTASRLVRLPSGRISRAFLIPIAGFALFAAIGYLSTARNQEIRGRGAGEEILAYLEFPLVNLLGQTMAVGLGPYELDSAYPLLPLVPYKWQTDLSQSMISPPRKVIPSSPSGMFERIHWAWGIGGIAVFCFLIGVVSQFLYHRSGHDIESLLIYCQVAYALLTAHSYNHFMNLIFIPLPCAVFLCIGSCMRRQHRQTSPCTLRMTVSTT